MKSLTIYTDGACSRNGRPGAKAGWAFYCIELDKALSGIVPPDERQTNNVGELLAIFMAMGFALQSGAEEILIFTDSNYCIGSLSKWKLKDWKVNYDLIAKTKKMMTYFKTVDFIWVKGHAGDELNEKVDALANEACGM